MFINKEQVSQQVQTVWTKDTSGDFCSSISFFAQTLQSQSGGKYE